jgi:hypothetical protein
MLIAKDTGVTIVLKAEENNAKYELQNNYYLPKMFLADNGVALEFGMLFYEQERGR